jgi:hypothetical protein
MTEALSAAMQDVGAVGASLGNVLVHANLTKKQRDKRNSV